MKKLFIYGIIIFSSILIVSACAVFIPIISKDHSNGAILNNGDTIVGDMEENLNEDYHQSPQYRALRKNELLSLRHFRDFLAVHPCVHLLYRLVTFRIRRNAIFSL